jgi:hypothetical protein
MVGRRKPMRQFHGFVSVDHDDGLPGWAFGDSDYLAFDSSLPPGS